jgi:DNA-binding transcriptional regulator LsrR (DeoR family)
MALAARRFFLEDRSKVEIGHELGMSRFRVARLLEQARATGVVTITVHDSGTPVPELGEEVRQHLGLRNAVVVEAGSTPDEVRSAVGTATARLLGETLDADEVVGLAWGRTLAAMGASLPGLPRVTVVQLTGATGVNLEDSPVEIVRQVALRSGGSAYPIFAPLVVEDAPMALALRRQPGVATAFTLFERLTTAVVSVGSWDPPDSQLFNYFEPTERGHLRERGVVAEVAATLIAGDGSWPAPEMAERSVAIPGDRLRRVPRIIAAAGGVDKARAVRAAVLAGLCTELVTDRSLAEAVLALPPVGPRPVHAGDDA